MELSRATLAVTTGRPARAPDGPLNPPVVLASTFHAGGSMGYGRYGNPTWAAFEEAIGALEQGVALSFASGLAATSAVLATFAPGSTFVIPRSPYLGTAGLFDELATRGQATVRRVDITDLEAVTEACTGADLIWLESPTNPLLGVADVRATCAVAHTAGAAVAVDSTFSTPMGIRPLELGADLVIHSATKQISGHSDVLLGVVVARDQARVDALDQHRRLHGSIPGPLETWLALRGLRTLPLRHQRGSESAAVLAARALDHPAVTRVRYPGLPDDAGHLIAAAQWDTFGSIFSLEIEGGAEAADRMCAAVQLWVNTTSLGGVESSLERRRRWLAESLDVPESLMRLSVGIEDVEDLWRDLESALNGIR